jgi:hypothetical protein
VVTAESLARDPVAATPMAGTFGVDGEALRFRPRFPFTPGLSYAFLDGHPSQPLLLIRPAAAHQASTLVTHIYPTAGQLPVNTLRFYVHFSAPMSEGLASAAIELRDPGSGQVLPGAFLPLEPELWDPARTRLTLLLDPGRIKRGLVPHTEAGYPLTPGRSVALVIHRTFLDASGAPLAAGAGRRYTVGPAIRDRLEPLEWRIEAVRAATQIPVQVIFGRPVDHALGLRCLTVIDACGQPVPGQGMLEAEERSWAFTPASPWHDAPYSLLVSPELEDVAGNSVIRVFDRDLTNPEHRPRPPEPAKLSLLGLLERFGDGDHGLGEAWQRGPVDVVQDPGANAAQVNRVGAPQRGQALLGQGHVEAASVSRVALLGHQPVGDEVVDQPGGPAPRQVSAVGQLGDPQGLAGRLGQVQQNTVGAE